MKKFRNLKFIALISFIVISRITFAANPSQPFLPSDNVQDPNCTPTDSNCYVLLTSFQNETVTGLDYATSTGILSLGAGYTIPTVASTTAWNSAIGALGGSALIQNGNSFGTTLTLGTNDTQALNFETNGISRLTIDISGNINATGTISASSFFGNGSNLTGIFSTSTSRNVFSANGPLMYSTSTGNFLLTQASSTSNGYLSSTDFATFSAKENSINSSTTATYFRGDKTFGTLDTSVVPENGNLYFTNARVNSILSATTSLPNITTLSGLVSATSLGALGTITTGVWNATPIGDSYITKTGNWTGIFDGQEGTYYLDRANHTGTQLASTILDFSTTTRGLLSSSATGLSYSTTTGIFSLTSGYSIPLTASTTVWESKVSSQWVTSGANVYYTAGNVGIGTTTPSAKLAVTGTAGTGNVFVVSSSTNASLFTVTGNGNVGIGAGTPTTQLTLFGNGSNPQEIKFSNSGSWFGSIGMAGGQNLLLSNNTNGGAMTDSAIKGIAISSNGNVGIGTTTPAYTFDVNGNARTQSALYVGTTTGSEGGNDNLIRTTSNSAFLNLKGGSGLAKITIGNTKLNLVNGNTGDINFSYGATSDTSNGTLGMVFSRTGGLVLGNTYGATDPGSGNMIISGNVGIGTTTPADRLQVFGDIRLGTTGSNGCIKDFGGTMIAGTCSSDERLKTNIVDLSDNYLDKMAKLRVITYNWNDTAKDLNRVDTTLTNYGLLAQNVEENFPELVTTDSNGYKQVNYSRIPLYLIKSIQELSKKVDTMFAWFKNDAFNIQSNVCVDDVCVSKEQFKQMLINAGNTQSNHINTSISTTPTPAPVVETIVETPTPVVAPDAVIVPSEPVIDPVAAAPAE